jgi:hypothetical protein
VTPLLRRSLAVVAGFAAVALLSIGADAVMHATGIFPPEPATMTAGLFALAATYRAAFTVAGGALTTALSREASYRPAQILSGFGLLGGLAGVAAWVATPDLGPLWYALSIPISAVPCTLLGAWLRLRPHQP